MPKSLLANLKKKRQQFEKLAEEIKEGPHDLVSDQTKFYNYRTKKNQKL